MDFDEEYRDDHDECRHEIESIRAQLAEVTRERDAYAERRCEVCGYAEHHREHTGCLRKQLLDAQSQLAEVTRERDAAYDAVDKNWVSHQQFLSTQAHAARLVEALTQVMDDIASEDYLFEGGNGISTTSETQAKKALSTPINLDALHDDRAATLLEAANHLKRIIGGDGIWQHEVEDELEKLAASNLAKKEGV